MKNDKNEQRESVLIFRTSRDLKDRLARKSAQNVIDGKHLGLGAGATYSVNRSVAELLAEELNIELGREEVPDAKTSRVGLTFFFPKILHDALKDRAQRDGISVNELMERLLQSATS